MQRRNVEFAALLHDVGKIAVPKEIINKPGPLDDAEWEIMRQHTIEGERMLKRVGGVLSEAGKIAVPNEIINKEGPLDDAEWKIMRRHTIEGERLLKRIGGVLADVGTIVRASHEDFDGSGYPDGLVGEEIPIEARIVTCCDAFSAMTTTRSYRKAMGTDAALAELRRCAGTQFDPEVVSVLIELVEAGEV